MYPSERMWPDRAAKPCLWFGLSIICCLVFWLAMPLPAQESGICQRTLQVKDAIVAASGAATCAQVTDTHLREITSLGLSDQRISSLSAGDLDGFHTLETLDLSDNSLQSLPAGVFDDLLLLRTLRLHGNSLTTLPAGIFDQLFLLEEITLNDNQFTSLPEGLFEDLSRFDGFAANGDAPNNSASYPRIQRFINRHSITSPEEFIAALPDAYKQRFVMMYNSGAPAAPHVSGDYPRVISFGGDGALTFAWTTDPSAPAELNQSVEFLRQNDTDWTAGVIDFSGESPQIVEPALCQICHSPLNKPMWGMWGEWPGSETVLAGRFDETVVQSAAAAMERALASSDPRIEPLDFSASSIVSNSRFLTPPDQPQSTAAVEEAGAVWAWRHAEVLYRILGQRHTDFRSFSDGVVCTAHDQLAAFELTLQSFSQPEQNLFVSDADPEYPDEPGYQPPESSDLVSYTYYFHPAGSLGDAVLFLLIADVWREEPIVRRLYRSVSNSDTVLPDVTGTKKSAMLYYPAGSATAEDELIQKLRLHFGQGTAASLDTRAEQNGRKYIGGVLSASFRTGHLSAIWPRICNALTGSVPGSLSVALEGGDAVLSWEAPTHDADAVTGYRIWRGSGAADPTVHVADSGSAETTWTDEDPAPGEYVYTVQALYDGYYASRETEEARATVAAPLTARVERLPERHDGNSGFTFELYFSEEVSLSYVTLRDSAFEVTAGRVVKARRQSRTSNRIWHIDVEPTSDADVELVLQAGRACGVTGAICTAADSRRLSTHLNLTVAGPPPAPLTAWAEMVPSHNGTTFRFRLRFSAEIDISYVTLRDGSFDVTRGSVIKARRLAPPSNRDWEITVAPDSNANVVLVLAADRACDTAGAICTAGGERLSNRLEITIRGPG